MGAVVITSIITLLTWVAVFAVFRNQPPGPSV